MKEVDNPAENRYVTYTRPSSNSAPITTASPPEVESNEIDVDELHEQEKTPTRRYGYKIVNRPSRYSRYSNYPTLYHSQV